MNQYWKTTVDLMESSKRVISAVDMAQTALTEGQSSDVVSTGDLLARTACDYAGHTGHYERLSFEKMAVVAQATEAEQLTSNLFINLLLEIGLSYS